jgi:hypothetical protein
MPSPGPRSGGPASRRSFTSAQKLDHLAAHEAAVENGQGDLQNLDSRAGALRRKPRESSSPAAHASRLLVGGKQDVCRVPHHSDRGQGSGVRVVQHGGAREVIEVEAQRGRVPRESQRARGPWRCRAGPKAQLPEKTPHTEMGSGGRGLDSRLPAPGHENQGQKTHPERSGNGNSESATHEHRGGRDRHRQRDAHDPGAGEAKQEAAMLQAPASRHGRNGALRLTPSGGRVRGGRGDATVTCRRPPRR